MAVALLALVMTWTLAPLSGASDVLDSLEAIKSTATRLWFHYDEMEKKTDALNALIYFHATFQTHQTISRGTVIFDKVLTNKGDAYNPAMGSFQALRDGVYVFAVRVFTRGSTVANWDLHVNGRLILRSKSRTLGDSSNQFVFFVNLEAGDQVSVYNSEALNIYGERHSFFSGWLMRAF